MISGIDRTLKVLEGLSSDRCFLSTNEEGTVVDLWSEKHESGRQSWRLERIDGEENVYNITINRGVDGDKRLFLSTTGDGEVVELWIEDDGSGRQRWVLEPVPSSDVPNYYTIRAFGGMDGGGRVYLSCVEDGTKVDLWFEDDGSGRQRWQVSGRQRSKLGACAPPLHERGGFSKRRGELIAWGGRLHPACGPLAPPGARARRG